MSRPTIPKGQATGVGLMAQKLWGTAMSGNVTAMIFWLKARGGWRDSDSRRA